jgi:branched-chain amino acid transport system permease protein
MLLLLLFVSGVMQGAPIALAGIGFAIIWYTTKEFHFLYGTLLATSGYLLYSLTQHGVNIWLAGLIVIVGTALLAAALENWGYIPLKNPLSVLLLSFGLAIVLQNVLQIIYGPANVIMPANVLETKTITVIPGTQATAQAIQLLSLGAVVVVSLLLAAAFKYTRTGLAMRAVMRDEEAASYVGIRPRRLRLLAYAVGTAVGSLGGIFTMINVGTSPTSGFDTMLYAFMATFLGAGIITRVPMWGMLIGILLSVEAWKLPASFSTLIVFALMLVYVIARQRLSSSDVRQALKKWRTASARVSVGERS